MYASAARQIVAGASGVAALFVDQRDCDTRGVAVPRPEVHVAVRFGPATRGGLDVHALGGLETVHRKLLRRGQRIAMARLQLGAAEAVLGVPASAIAGRIVALEDLWGEASTQRLLARCAEASDTFEAAAILEQAIAERFAIAGGPRASTPLVLDAAHRFRSGNVNVNAVAADLGVSERHLRRVFGETIGMSPKTFAKLTRFRRAVGAARVESRATWATIAAATGYYDQAHLIAEFRSIAGVTPCALLGELRTAHSMG